MPRLRLPASQVPPPPAPRPLGEHFGLHDQVRLAQVLSALTYALDLTEGQRPGHTLRTAIIAMRLATELSLSEDDAAALYYAALLKDSGCSSNAARMAALFGSDDQFVKREMRLVDWHDRWKLAVRTAKSCGVGSSSFAQLRHFILVARTPSVTREIIEARCNRGAQIASGLGFPQATADSIAHVDEHWCGLGQPQGLSGAEIPTLSRILLLSQTVEVFWTEHKLDDALNMVQERSGRWFDPAMAKTVLSWKKDIGWWKSVADPTHTTDTVLALEPGHDPLVASDERLDTIAHAFASVIDAKTPFTFSHSTNVARYSEAISLALGHDPVFARDVLRAGLLHDIGKLGVSNRILDKPGKLTDAERLEVMRHPVWTWEILQHVPAFHRFAVPASFHHERLDGAGYPWGMTSGDLDVTARILAIADVYEALTANRPYRAGMDHTAATEILRKGRSSAFDADILDLAEGVLRDIASPDR